MGRAMAAPGYVSSSPDAADAACGRTYSGIGTGSAKDRTANLKLLQSVVWPSYDGSTMFLAIHPWMTVSPGN